MSANNNADIKMVQAVNTKLAMRGIRSPCNVSTSCRGGEVTLTGTVAQAHQKLTAARIAEGINGVKRVINQLVVKAAVRG